MRKPVLLLMLFAVALASVAQQPPISHLEINNVRPTILGDGSCFTEQQWNGQGQAPCTTWDVPAGSGKETIFQHALWFGGMDGETLHLAGLKYNQGSDGHGGQDYWMGPLKTTDATTDFYTSVKYHYIWNITRAEIEQFIANHGNAGYQIPEDILTWPAHGDPGYAENLAPFVDVNGDGHYNPADGDYPDIKGDQCLFFIFNDSFNSHTETQGMPVGLEVHGMVYGFDVPDDEALYNTVFVNYKFFNRSANDYNSTYLGLWTDWDIGFMNDDYVGCDVQRNSCYGYNGTSYDGSGQPQAYDSIPPVQVVTILTSPDNLGMTGFMYHDNDGSVTGEPQYAEHYYNLLKSCWLDGNHLCFGGNGYPQSGNVGPECNYMFPGDTDPDHPDLYWTEESAGIDPGDRRGLASVGPFDFHSGDMKELDYAMITVFPDESQTAMERRSGFIDHIKTLFENGFAKKSNH